MLGRGRECQTRLYIGRLTPDIREGELELKFCQYGSIREVNVKEGFGFVEYYNHVDANQARMEMDGYYWEGTRLSVEFARTGPRRGGGGGEGRRGGGEEVRGLGRGGGGGRGADWDARSAGSGRGGFNDRYEVDPRGGPGYAPPMFEPRSFPPPPSRGRTLPRGYDRQICYNCGREGHMARDCREGDWTNRCYACGESGHIRSQCTQSLRSKSYWPRSSPPPPPPSLRRNYYRSRSRSPRYGFAGRRSRSRSPGDNNYRRRRRSLSSISRSRRRRSPSPVDFKRGRPRFPSPNYRRPGSPHRMHTSPPDCSPPSPNYRRPGSPHRMHTSPPDCSPPREQMPSEVDRISNGPSCGEGGNDEKQCIHKDEIGSPNEREEEDRDQNEDNAKEDNANPVHDNEVNCDHEGGGDQNIIHSSDTEEDAIKGRVGESEGDDSHYNNEGEPPKNVNP